MKPESVTVGRVVVPWDQAAYAYHAKLRLGAFRLVEIFAEKTITGDEGWAIRLHDEDDNVSLVFFYRDTPEECAGAMTEELQRMRAALDEILAAKEGE